MNLLALSTSASHPSIAVKKGLSGTVEELSLPGSVNHVEKLMPAVDELLKKHALTLSEIDYYLIDRGPGSFTGLRIGFATLKAFRFLQKKDCFGLFSLDVIAENNKAEENSLLTVLTDARREQLYVRTYKRTAQNWNPVSNCEALSLRDAAARIPDGALAAGDALERYKEMLEKFTAEKKIRWAPMQSWYPSAAVMIRMFENKDSKLKTLDQPADMIPFYVRLSEPEEKQKNACLS